MTLLLQSNKAFGISYIHRKVRVNSFENICFMLKAKTVAFFLVCILLCIVTQKWNKGIRVINLCFIFKEVLVRGQDSARAENGVTVLQGYTKGMVRLTANIWKRVWQCTQVVIHSQNTFPSFSNLQFVGFHWQILQAWVWWPSMDTLLGMPGCFLNTCPQHPLARVFLQPFNFTLDKEILPFPFIWSLSTSKLHADQFFSW